MAYEKFNKKDDLLLFLDLEKIQIDPRLREIISKLLDRHILTTVESNHVDKNDSGFRLTLDFKKNGLCCSLEKNFLKKPGNDLMNKFESFLSAKPLNVYDVDEIMPLIIPLLKFGYTVEEEKEYFFILNNGTFQIHLELKPYDITENHGRITLYQKNKYFDCLSHRALYDLNDVKILVKDAVLAIKTGNAPNIEETLEYVSDLHVFEELFNLGYEQVDSDKPLKMLESLNLIKEYKFYKIYCVLNEDLSYVQIEESGNVIYNNTSTDVYVDGLKYLLQKEYNEDIITEKKIISPDDDRDDENVYLGTDGVEKLYDFFLEKGMSVTDMLYDYLKEAVVQNVLVSLDMKGTKMRKTLKIQFKLKNIDIELKPELSISINGRPQLVWIPKDYVKTVQLIKQNINTKTKKIEMSEVKLSKFYKKLIQYGFEDISTTEDNLKRRLFLQKGYYTYQIFSDGVISIYYYNKGRSYEIMLEDGSYLFTLEEYSIALNKVLTNYFKFSKEYGFNVNFLKT